MPGALAQSQEEVDAAEADRARALEEYIRVQDEVDAALAAYENIRGEIFEVEYRMERLESRIGEDAEAAAALEATARELAVEAYIAGSLGTFSVALEACMRIRHLLAPVLATLLLAPAAQAQDFGRCHAS